MKIAIAQSGPENSGKTSTIRMMYETLIEKYSDANVEFLLNRNGEVRAVITIAGIRIGIESQGDPWKKAARLDPSLALFVRLDCEVIICATRTFGGTREAFLRLEAHGYQAILRDRSREIGDAKQRKCNRAEAAWMLAQVEAMFATSTVES